MTDELVHRLRLADADTKAIFGEDFVSTQGEAADEIERLRAEVAEYHTALSWLAQFHCNPCLEIDKTLADALVEYTIARINKAESALAALRKRVEEAQILERYESIAFGFGDNKLALVVLD